MYITNDFAVAEQPQEDRRKKGSLAPWLIGGGLLTAGGIGLALASKGKVQPNAELVKKGVDDGKQLLNKQTAQAIKDMKARHKTVVKSSATGYKGLRPEDRKLVLQSRKDILKRSGLEKLEKSSDRLDINRVNNNILSTERNRDRINNTIKRVGTINYMKYTTTADFAMAGAIGGGMKTGVLSRITGQLGNTVDKAKNWLSKAGQAKQEIGGSAAIAKNRLKPAPYVSPNAGAEAIARRKYAESLVPAQKAAQQQEALGRGQTMKSNLGKLASDRQKGVDLANIQGSDSLRNATLQNNRSYAQKIDPTVRGLGATGSTLANQQSLRLKYTKDPRTGKLVSAAYSKQLSLLCDL